jgi:hypothetical protein
MSLLFDSIHEIYAWVIWKHRIGFKLVLQFMSHEGGQVCFGWSILLQLFNLLGSKVHSRHSVDTFNLAILGLFPVPSSDRASNGSAYRAFWSRFFLLLLKTFLAGVVRSVGVGDFCLNHKVVDLGKNLAYSFTREIYFFVNWHFRS